MDETRNNTIQEIGKVDLLLYLRPNLIRIPLSSAKSICLNRVHVWREGAQFLINSLLPRLIEVVVVHFYDNI